MTLRDGTLPRRPPDFSEVFRNRYVTSLSPGVFLATAFHILVGVVFFVLLLASVCLYPLWLLYLVFGLDPFRVISVETPPDMADLIAGPFVMLFFLAGVARYWGAVKQRLFSRLHVLAGRPLACVEGRPDFDFGEERCWGLKVAGRYFKLDIDCWAAGVELDKLQAAGGVLRIWYVPSTGVMVRAEWRPSA